MYMCCRACGRPRARRPLANERHSTLNRPTPAPSMRPAGSTGWYFHYSGGAPKYQELWLSQLPVGTQIIFATRYPAGTKVRGSGRACGWAEGLAGGWAGGCMAGAAGLAAAPRKAQGNAAGVPCLHARRRRGLALARRAFPRPCDACLFAAPSIHAPAAAV